MRPGSPQSGRLPRDFAHLEWLQGAGAGEGASLGPFTLLCFWSPSSVACLQALDTLATLLPRFEGVIAVVGVHSPRYPRERDHAAAKDAVARYAIPYPVVHDPAGDLRTRYAVRDLPSLILLGRDGSCGRLAGDQGPRAVRELLERTLTGAPSAPEPVRVLDPNRADAAGTASVAPGPLRFPSAIKAMQGAATHPGWAIADAGHHQIVLLDDYGRERERFGTGHAALADGNRETAGFRSPQGLICSTETVFVADTGNHAIRRIDVAQRRVQTVAGTGRAGGSLPTEARDALSTPLSSPWDLELDGDNLYFSNAGSHQIGVYDCVERTVTRVAGSGLRGTAEGPASQAAFAQPTALAIEDSGERLFVADSDSGLVRSLTLDERPAVSNVYGPGSRRTSLQGRLQYPLGLAWADGYLLIADSYNDRLLSLPLDRRGLVEPGAEPWTGHLPGLSQPAGLWAEDFSRLLVVDKNNHRIVHYIDGQRRTQLWPLPAG